MATHAHPDGVVSANGDAGHNDDAILLELVTFFEDVAHDLADRAADVAMMQHFLEGGAQDGSTRFESESSVLAALALPEWIFDRVIPECIERAVNRAVGGHCMFVPHPWREKTIRN